MAFGSHSFSKNPIYGSKCATITQTRANWTARYAVLMTSTSMNGWMISLFILILTRKPGCQDTFGTMAASMRREMRQNHITHILILSSITTRYLRQSISINKIPRQENGKKSPLICV